MVRATLTQRVEVLEQVVSDLATLPARVTAVERELAGFRADVRQEFATVRSELRAGHDELKKAIETGAEETRRYMRMLYEDLVARIATIGESR